MTIYYLRIEGVNLGAVLDDTPQVSVQRGASYLLRKAAITLTQPDTVGLRLTPISIGASIGVYECEAEPDQEQVLAATVQHALNSHDDYRHFTFVVAAVAASDNFQQDCERLITLNRWQQMQMPALSLEGLAGSTQAPCGWQGVRPADTHKWMDQDTKIPMSRSVLTRYNAGRDLRQEFYRKEAGNAYADCQFTDDLHQLANNPNKGQLSDKLAVFYFDGNQFGKLLRRIIGKHKTEDPKALYRDVDNKLREFLRGYLAAFLTHARANTDYLTDDGRLRLEVLMWGGDEVLIVVPAWCGLDSLAFFYNHIAEWNIKNEPLTFASGIIFAHQKTPLSRLKQCVKEELAENVKKTLKKMSGQKEKSMLRNGFDYLILESIDYPVEPLAQFRQKVYRDLSQSLVPLAPFTPEALAALAELKASLPKSQCYQLAHAILQAGDLPALDASETSTSLASQALARLELVTQGGAERCERVTARYLCDVFGQPLPAVWRWLHLLELWDYLPTVPSAEEGSL